MCIRAPKETCLTGGCGPWGDCRELLSGTVLGPPLVPAPESCWPNKAVLSNTCVRLSLLLERVRLPTGVSTEGLCGELRALLAAHQASSRGAASLVVLCDLRTGTNDTLEVTMVSITNNYSHSAYWHQNVFLQFDWEMQDLSSGLSTLLSTISSTCINILFKSNLTI